MNRKQLPVLFLFIIGALSLLAGHSAVASPTFKPVLSAVDSDTQDVYLLDAHETTINQIVFRKYRLWRNTYQTQQLELVSRLGTKWLPSRQNLVGMHWDSTQQRLLFADTYAKRIFSLNPANNKTTLISGAKKGSGAALEKLGGLVLDPIENRLIVVDQASLDSATRRILTQVELATGDRSVFYSLNSDASKDHRDYFIAIDPNTYQVFLAYGPGIAAIDLYSGQSRAVSDQHQGVGQGPAIIRAEQLAFDFNRHRLIVAEPLLKRILAIDIATGERSVIVDALAKTDHQLCWPDSLSVLADTSFIGDIGHQSWLKLDLISNQWQGFPAELAANTSSCARAINTEVKKLLVGDLALLANSAALSPEVTVAQNMETEAAGVTFRQFLRQLWKQTSTLWSNAFKLAMAALTLVELAFLWPFFLAIFLFAAQFYYVFLLLTAPLQTLITFLFGSQAVALELSLINSVLIFMLFSVPFLPFTILNAGIASVIASFVTLPYIPFVIIRALFPAI